MKGIIVSENVKLKPLEEKDAQDIFQTIDNERNYLGKWLPFVPHTKTAEDSLNFIRSVLATPEENREMIFCIYFQEKFAGLIGLKFNANDKANQRTEIGYWLSEAYQKKGIVTQSVIRLIEYAFVELALNRIQIKCAVGNIPSKNIPKRLGFTLEGVERDGELLADGQFTDIEVYSVLKKEWKWYVHKQ